MKSRRTLSIMLFAGSICGCNTDTQVETVKYRASAPEVRKTVAQNTVAQTVDTADQLIQPLPEGKLPGNVFELQRKTYEEFNDSFEFGHSRMAPSHGLPEADDRYLLHGMTLKFTDPGRGHWRMNNVQLIGVVKNPWGQVYGTKKGDDASVSRKNTPKTRPLDDFETAALEKIRTGTNVEVKIVGEKMRVVGAIRAVSLDCVRCHRCEKYKLLGAFTYELERAKW